MYNYIITLTITLNEDLVSFYIALLSMIKIETKYYYFSNFQY